jgi:hypothetical protein
MDFINEFSSKLLIEIRPIIDWALRNWAMTLVILAAMVYWAGRDRRKKKHA